MACFKTRILENKEQIIALPQDNTAANCSTLFSFTPTHKTWRCFLELILHKGELVFFFLLTWDFCHKIALSSEHNSKPEWTQCGQEGCQKLRPSLERRQQGSLKGSMAKPHQSDACPLQVVLVALSYPRITQLKHKHLQPILNSTHKHSMKKKKAKLRRMSIYSVYIIALKI